VEEDSKEIHGVELCLEGFSKICSGGSGRIIGENWTRVVGFPLTALDKIGVAMGVGGRNDSYLSAGFAVVRSNFHK
jgi:hypothetical protein